MDTAVIRTKLAGTGMKLLDGIDPNKENYVCAGIIHTRSQQIGCLLRLEPNRQAQVRFLSLSLALLLLAVCVCNFNQPKWFPFISFLSSAYFFLQEFPFAGLS